MELKHSRTKGSKNGIRLYQNKDGTWTELGKERRRKGRSDSIEKKRADSDKRLRKMLDDVESDETFKKSAKLMEDISSKSVDWYESDPKSDRAKKVYKNYTNQSIQKKLDAANEKLYDLKKSKFDELDKLLSNGTFSREEEKLKTKEVMGEIKTSKELAKVNKYTRMADDWKRKKKNELLGVVLKDLGYEDTEKGRQWIRDYVFWD